MSAPVKTFSVGFVEDGDRSELGDAREVASAFGADHHELELSMSDTTTSLEDLVWALDEPLADLSALGFKVLSELAAQHVTVAIAGQGADRAVRRLFAVPPCRVGRAKPVAAAAGGGRGGVRSRQGGRSLRAVCGRTPRGRLCRSLPIPSRAESRRDAAALARPRSSSAPITRAPMPRWRATPPASTAVHSRMPSTSTPNSGWSTTCSTIPTALSMAHSLEVQVPFLDHRVVELAATIPTALKVKGGTTKYLLKQIAPGPRPRQDHRQAENRLLQSRRRQLAPSPARRP